MFLTSLYPNVRTPMRVCPNKTLKHLIRLRGRQKHCGQRIDTEKKKELNLVRILNPKEYMISGSYPVVHAILLPCTSRTMTILNVYNTYYTHLSVKVLTIILSQFYNTVAVARWGLNKLFFHLILFYFTVIYTVPAAVYVYIMYVPRKR